MAIHKGTELNNVKETWQQNENENRGGAPERLNTSGDEATGVDSDLQQTIREEAAAYDKANKEDRLLGGERATMNDDQ